MSNYFANHLVIHYADPSFFFLFHMIMGHRMSLNFWIIVKKKTQKNKLFKLENLIFCHFIDG